MWLWFGLLPQIDGMDYLEVFTVLSFGIVVVVESVICVDEAVVRAAQQAEVGTSK